MKNIIDFIKKYYKIIGVVFVLLIMLSSIIYFQHRSIVNLKIKNEKEVKLRTALLDSVEYYRNERKELVAEKLTMQETIKNLGNITNQLNSMQKELITRIKEVEKKNDVIAAALFETSVKVDSLLHGGETEVDIEGEKITFRDLYKKDKKEVRYSFIVGKVLPADIKIKPTLLIDSLYFPNIQFVDFKWKDDRKAGYPVSFSVTNSNDFFKTSNIESYIIPNITKEHLNPNGWQKIENFFIRNKNKTFYIGIGVGVGAAGTLLLLK